MHFRSRGIRAHAPPRPLGSISSVSTPLSAPSTRKATQPKEADIKNETSVRKLSKNDFDLGPVNQISLSEVSA